MHGEGGEVSRPTDSEDTHILDRLHALTAGHRITIDRELDDDTGESVVSVYVGRRRTGRDVEAKARTLREALQRAFNANAQRMPVTDKKESADD